MEDSKIVQLYWDRSNEAIPATSEKYGRYCNSIALNILGNWEDAEECVNDTYLSAWNSMPPHRPGMLSTFLGKITRNLSINKHKYNHAGKRGNGEIELVLEELRDMVSGKDDIEQQVAAKELQKEIDTFLSGLSKQKRGLFVRRYWYMEPVPELAKQFHMSQNNVSVTLNRIRKQMKTYLEERGYEI